MRAAGRESSNQFGLECSFSSQGPYPIRPRCIGYTYLCCFRVLHGYVSEPYSYWIRDTDPLKYPCIIARHILRDLAPSSGYRLDYLRCASSNAMRRMSSSCGLDHPCWCGPCPALWVLGVVPPMLVPEHLVSVEQRRLDHVRAVNCGADQFNWWYDQFNQ
jgi:hypothetical protein